MRILFIHPHIMTGGAEKALVYLANLLREQGHTVAVCTLSVELKRLPPIAKSIRYLLPERPLWPPKLRSVTEVASSVISEVRALADLLHQHSSEYDIVAPCNFPAYWSVCSIKRFRPTVWVSSEVLGPYNATRDLYDESLIFKLGLKAASLLDRRIVRSFIDGIVTCSELNRKLIRERYGLDAMVIPTGVDYDFFSERPSGSVDELDGYFSMLHVGSLVKRKNHILSIRALHKLKEKRGDAKLVIVGEGPWKQRLGCEAAKLGLKKYVIFRGNVSEEELRLLFYSCDVNLYPVEDQTHGLVPFESIVAGKPSLVSRCSGAGQLLAQLKLDHFLIEPSVDQILDGINRVFSNPDKTSEAIERCRDYVRTNLTWREYAKKMSKFFKALVESKGNKA